ncbi:hypothetical protein Bbelb_257350 [Branchiostoma belcheri]|nr:hypothetical protein Bbelb_257350 [Branchiostoma belcheri]
MLPCAAWFRPPYDLIGRLGLSRSVSQTSAGVWRLSTAISESGEDRLALRRHLLTMLSAYENLDFFNHKLKKGEKLAPREWTLGPDRAVWLAGHANGLQLCVLGNWSLRSLADHSNPPKDTQAIASSCRPLGSPLRLATGAVHCALSGDLYAVKCQQC